MAALAVQRSLAKLVLNCVPALTDATVKALVASCRCLPCFCCLLETMHKGRPSKQEAPEAGQAGCRVD